MASSVSFGHDTVVPLYINGEAVESGSTFGVKNPNGSYLWKCSNAGEAEVDSAIVAAHTAFKSWSKMSIRNRAAILGRTLALLEQRQGELMELLAKEVGSPEQSASYIFQSIRNSIASDLEDAVSIKDEIDLDNEAGTFMTIHQPWGVVLSIVPWNGPFYLFMRAVVQPLIMGNTVIVKGSERSPACFAAMTSIFIESGVPPGVLNTIYCKHDDGPRVTEQIIAHPFLRKLNFTGSSAVGASVAAVAGKHLKPSVMELGGKSGSIICEDADLDAAVQSVVMGAFIFGGHVCVGTERVILVKSVAEQFKQKLGPTIKTFFGEGEAAELQMQSPEFAQRNRKLVADAIEDGATLIYGDPSKENPDSSKMAPVVLEGVGKGAEIYAEESFGPSLSLYTVDTEDAAVELCNDTRYGLAAAIWTKNLQRGLRLAKGVEAGCIRINGSTLEAGLAHAMGGWKNSGFGRFGGSRGLLEWTQVKTLSWPN